MFADIDDARMIMSEPQEDMSAIVWFGGNQLILFDETLSMVATKSFVNVIKDADDARATAQKWFDEMKEEKKSFSDRLAPHIKNAFAIKLNPKAEQMINNLVDEMEEENGSD